MAVYKNIGTGNFTAANWEVVQGYENTETSVQLLTTTAVAAPNYTAGVETVDGVLVKFGLIQGTAGQIAATTVTAQLFNVTTATVVASTTINVSDLDTALINFPSPFAGGSWHYLKFSAPILLVVGQNYAVRLLVNSGGASVWAWRAAANAWNRGIVTTTTGTPAATDTLIVTGEYTGAGTSNSFTVTNNNTATTTFANFFVGAKGTFAWGTTAATNYYLKLAGNLNIGVAGLMSMGTSGTPMPSTSSAILEFVCASSGQFGMIVYGTLQTYGATKTVSAKLNANAAALATSLTTNISTNWKNGDILGLAGTTQTNTQAEKITCTADAVTTTLTVSALVNAHGGVAPVVADIVNLRRNVRIIGTSTTNVAYINFPSGINTTSYLYYTEIYFCGNTTIGKSAIGIGTSGSIDVSYCSIYDNPNGYGFLHNGATIGTINFANNVTYNNSIGIWLSSAATGTWTVSNNISIRSSITLNDVGGTFTNNIVTNATSTGITISEQFGEIVSFSGLTYYGGGSTGINVNCAGTISNLTVWRTASIGLTTPAILQSGQMLMFDTFTLFGNATVNLLPAASTGLILFKTGTVFGGTTQVAQYGIWAANTNDHIIVQSTAFSGHSIADIYGVSQGRGNNFMFLNSTFTSAVEIISQSSLDFSFEGYGVTSVNHQNVAGVNKAYTKNGTVQTDTVIFNTASPSVRLTPTSTSFKLYAKPFKVAVSSGQTCTVSVEVRKSTLADGTAYNGNQPRLMVRINPIAGIASNTVLDTMVVAAGTWETLTGTTVAVAQDCILEFYVDCDGTFGWINFDDFSTTTNVNTKGMGYWDFGQPYTTGIFSAISGQKSYTFVG
jgi:hypothetical protein